VSDDKEPETAASFFDSALKKVQNLIDKAKTDRLLKELTPREKLDALEDDVKRGKLTQSFLSSDFWVKHFEPMLRKEAHLKPWAPGDPRQMEEVSTLYLHSSGKVWLLDFILKKFQDWVTRGERAQVELEREAKKHQSIDRTSLRV
jgi:hypothetical protein